MRQHERPPYHSSVLVPTRGENTTIGPTNAYVARVFDPKLVENIFAFLHAESKKGPS